MKEKSQTYAAKYQRKQYYKKRNILIKEMGNRCANCNSSEDLEFDHIDRNQKTYSIGKIFNRSLDFIREELKKCQLLCGKCHKLKTKLYRDWVNPANSPQPPGDWKHGTHHTYYARGCRCVACYAYVELRNANRRVSEVPRPQTRELIHGTRGGYIKERRRGLDPCDDCKAANADYARKHRSKK